MEDPRQDMKAATWSARGWTYQEMMLSQRLVFFIDCQVYFQCRERLVMEQMEKDWADILAYSLFQASQPMARLPDAHGCVNEANELVTGLAGIFKRSLLAARKPPFYGIPVFACEPSSCDPDRILFEFGFNLAWVVKGIQD